jgi:RNA polymerase sigma-70 factor (ECF subfamily)
VDAREKAQFAGRIRSCAEQLGQEGATALAPLYDLTAPRLLRYAFTVTRHQDDAEDAVQAALVKIALKPRFLADAGFPWAYLLRIVRNEALAITRRRKSLLVVATLVEARNDEPASYEDEEIKLSIRAAVSKLPREQAEVVVLKIWEEMTFSEIGTVLGESPNTAASRYRYAMAKLSQTLRRYSREMLYD